MKLTRDALAACIDHTVLGPETSLSQVEQLCEEAQTYGMNVCVPPCYLSTATGNLYDLTVATVIGFPHGQNAPAAKLAEVECAWADGADELDVVMNIGRLKAGEDALVREELARLTTAVPLPVKVIIETALLTDEEKHRACIAAADADADMVKTSTGFADGGATVADVELMSEYLPVKASGGVGSYEQAVAVLEAGADRIGASSSVEILAGAPE
jgi:deoxyribose-phosphate aldolase